MAVTFRGSKVVGVVNGHDTYTGQALEIARGLKDKFGDRVYRAEVDRVDGLLIYWETVIGFELGDGSHPRGHHFVTPICGYGGSGPTATSQILEMFGFGTQEDLLSQINFGGDMAYFTFSRHTKPETA